MKNLLLFLLYISTTIDFAASPLTIKQVDHQIIYYGFNHQFAEADELIEREIASDPDVPKYYFLKIVYQSLKDLAGADNLDFEMRGEFKRKTNSELITYTESLLKKFENLSLTPENKFYMGNIYGYLGRMYGFERSYMSAFSYAKKGKNLLEELVEEYPDFYDAYLLLGMFEYYADRLGGITEFIAAILGFTGDRNTGIDYLKLAYEKGELTKPFAGFILAETYSLQESNNFDAAEYFETLSQNYPNNKSFNDWYLIILLRLDKLSEAQKFIAGKGDMLGGFGKGFYYFKKGEYENARTLLKQLIDKKEFKWRFAYNYSKFLYVLSSLLLNKSAGTIEKELDDRFANVLNEFRKNLNAARVVMNFASSVGIVPEDELSDSNSINIDLPEKGIIRSMRDFYTGVLFFKRKDYTAAERTFLNIANRKEDYQTESVEYLIEIYKRIKAPKHKIELLEDIITDLDHEDLEFSLMALSR